MPVALCMGRLGQGRLKGASVDKTRAGHDGIIARARHDEIIATERHDEIIARARHDEVTA